MPSLPDDPIDRLNAESFHEDLKAAHEALATAFKEATPARTAFLANSIEELREKLGLVEAVTVAEAPIPYTLAERPAKKDKFSWSAETVLVNVTELAISYEECGSHTPLVKITAARKELQQLGRQIRALGIDLEEDFK